MADNTLTLQSELRLNFEPSLISIEFHFDANPEGSPSGKPNTCLTTVEKERKDAMWLVKPSVLTRDVIERAWLAQGENLMRVHDNSDGGCYQAIFAILFREQNLALLWHVLRLYKIGSYDTCLFAEMTPDKLERMKEAMKYFVSPV